MGKHEGWNISVGSYSFSTRIYIYIYIYTYIYIYIWTYLEFGSGFPYAEIMQWFTNNICNVMFPIRPVRITGLIMSCFRHFHLHLHHSTFITDTSLQLCMSFGACTSPAVVHPVKFLLMVLSNDLRFQQLDTEQNDRSAFQR